jgi:hypothetical protein
MSEAESESELLYDWQFTTNQFILATSPLKPTTGIFIFQLNTCVWSLCNIFTREDGSVVYNYCWSLPAQSFTGPSPAELMTTFYRLRFETPPTWRARSLYLYPPGTGWPGYMPRQGVPLFVVSYNLQGYSGGI